MSKILGVHTSPGLKIGYNSTGGAAFSMAAGDLHFVRVFAGDDGVLYNLSCFRAAQAANVRSVMGIYTDVAGSPSTLLAQTSENVNTVGAFGSQLGATQMYPLQNPVPITRGSVYWLAYIQNTTANIETVINTSTIGINVHKSIGYTTTLPASVTAPFTSPSGGISPLGGW